MNLKKGIRAQISGQGVSFPERIIDNNDLEQLMMTTTDFIVSRTGMERRYYVSAADSNASLSLAAIDAALQDAGTKASDIDMLIVSTLSPDYHDPSQACLIHGMIHNIREIPMFDIRAQCSGFLYGTQIAQGMIAIGAARNVLVVCVEVLSRRVIGDMNDRNLAILVGDGAAAFVVSPAQDPEGPGILDLQLSGSGKFHDTLRTAQPGVFNEGCFFPHGNSIALYQFNMDGPRLWSHAVETMIGAAESMLRKHGLGIEDIEKVFCHQPNMKMVEEIADHFAPHQLKFTKDGREIGNIGSATVAACWALHAKGMAPGSLSLILVYGAGSTWGAALYRH